MEQGNKLKIHVVKHGQKEAFQISLLAVKTTVNREPRWFSFGLEQMALEKQLLVMKSVTGEARMMDKATADRRKAIWLDHPPTIAQQHCVEWEAQVDGVSATRSDPQTVSDTHLTRPTNYKA